MPSKREAQANLERKIKHRGCLTEAAYLIMCAVNCSFFCVYVQVRTNERGVFDVSMIASCVRYTRRMKVEEILASSKSNAVLHLLI